MKTTLENRVQATATKARALGQKALQHPVSSILSLCLLAGLGASLVTFSQTPPAGQPPATAAAPAPSTTLPVARTITDMLLG